MHVNFAEMVYELKLYRCLSKLPNKHCGNMYYIPNNQYQTIKLYSVSASSDSKDSLLNAALIDSH